MTDTTKPRTVDQIEHEAEDLCSGDRATREAVAELIREAYALGAASRASPEADAEELERYRMRLAGALTTVEGHMLDVQDDPRTADYLRTCPTIRACIDVRRRLDAAEKELAGRASPEEGRLTDAMDALCDVVSECRHGRSLKAIEKRCVDVLAALRSAPPEPPEDTGRGSTATSVPPLCCCGHLPDRHFTGCFDCGCGRTRAAPQIDGSTNAAPSPSEGER